MIPTVGLKQVSNTYVGPFGSPGLESFQDPSNKGFRAPSKGFRVDIAQI